jgi:hypothetical protein
MDTKSGDQKKMSPIDLVLRQLCTDGSVSHQAVRCDFIIVSQWFYGE